MSGRRSRLLIGLVGTVMVAGLAAIPSAQAYPYAIQIKQVGIKKTKSYPYRNYVNETRVPTEDFDAGVLKVVATPYKISEGLRKKDQYLLNLNLTRSKKQGGQKIGWAQIYVTPRNYQRISDSAATADAQSGRTCSSIDLGLNQSFGPISVSTKIGTLSSCANTKIDLTNHSNSSGATGWIVRGLKNLKSGELELYMQVPQGVRPSWRVAVTVPRDSCTVRDDDLPGVCYPTDAEVTQKFFVNSSG